jgi:hypothetical protein
VTDQPDPIRDHLRHVYGPDVIAWIEADADGYLAARAQADALEAAYREWMERTREQLATEMPALMEAQFGVILPPGVHFAYEEGQPSGA